MKKLNLISAKNTLSRKEMKSINGGYSWLYCYYHTFGDNATVVSAKDWTLCRSAHDN